MNERTPPSMIEIMLQIYYSPDFVPPNTIAARQAIDNLVCNELIDRRPEPGRPFSETRGYEATERGQAWVEMICATPFPVQRSTWIDPRT